MTRPAETARPARRPGHRRRAPRQPARLEPDPNARRIIAYGLRNPFRFAIRPGTSEIWVGDVGRATGRRSTASPTRPTRVENFGWPCYEGAGAPGRLRQRRTSSSARTSTPAPARSRAVLHVQPRATRWSPARPARPAARRSRAWLRFYQRRPLPGRLRRRALLRRLLPQLHLGDVTRRERPARPRTTDSSCARPPNPVDLEIGPGGDLFYADFDGGTDPSGSSTRPATSRRRPSRRRSRRAARAAHGQLRRQRLERSRRRHADLCLGPGRRRPVRRFDAATPTYTYTQTGNYTAGLRVTDTQGASDTRRCDDHRRQHPADGRDRPRRRRRSRWKVGDSSLLRLGPDPEDGTFPALRCRGH